MAILCLSHGGIKTAERTELVFGIEAIISLSCNIGRGFGYLSPRDKALNLVFLYKVSFSAVSSRFWGAESKSDECQTGTLEHFHQNAKIQDGRRPPWEKYF